MSLLFLLFWMCQLSDGAFKGRDGDLPTSLKTRWYGPSYQPRGWRPDDFVGLRSEDWGYDQDNGGALKGIMIGGMLGALAGVMMQQKSQGIILMASQGAQTLGAIKMVVGLLICSPTWPAKFKGCAGNQQSPIDIDTEKLIKKKTKKSLKFSNYTNVPDKMILENSQHSIHLTGVWKRSNSTPFVTGGPLENRYYYSQLHFHWGKTPDTGSEHKVDGKSFPVEMHVVHDRFLEDPTNVSEEGDSNHLVVVTYMLEISNKDNPALSPILEASKRVRGNKKKRTEVRPFALDDVVDPFHGDYVTYRGSLTTPPCTEGVIWIINSKPLEISNNQLKVLRNSVKNRKGDTFANDRTIQPVNGRKIYYIYC